MGCAGTSGRPSNQTSEVESVQRSDRSVEPEDRTSLDTGYGTVLRAEPRGFGSCVNLRNIHKLYVSSVIGRLAIGERRSLMVIPLYAILSEQML